MKWLKCQLCGAKVSNDSFKDHESIKEFLISGMCQKCQDKKHSKGENK